MNTYFAVSAPGLEKITAQELLDLGIVIHSIEPGGIAFKGELPTLYQANLHLRTANRVLARLGNFFYATSSAELHHYIARLPWERFLFAGRPVQLRVTSHKSKLFHTDAVAHTISLGMAERLGQPSPISSPEEEPEQPAQLVVVRLMQDQVTVSIDSSGAILYKRGYRKAVAKAPLRETLAAAILMASGWDRKSPLIDPFCGSGTIPIEAAMLSQGIPPGINRHFAFMTWPSFNQSLWQEMLGGLSPKPITHPEILASDRDAGAIRMAQANADRAGVLEQINFSCQAISNINPPSGPGWVVTNPPYGQRVSEGKDLRNLYAQFGNVLRKHCPGWVISVLSNDRILLGQIGIPLEPILSMNNGGIHVMLMRGIVE